MEAVAAFPASFTAFPPNWDRSRSASRVSPRSLISNNPIQQRLPMMMTRRKANLSGRKCTAIRAFMQPSDASSSEAPIAPLQLESSFGQFLSQILVSHPHLFHAAVDKQLEQLQTDHEQEKELSSFGTEFVLYRRIAEVKASERRKVLEEILYAMLVQEFMAAGVHLIPSIAMMLPDNSGGADSWSSQEDKLEHVHSPEAYEMVMNHMTLVLGNRLGESNSVMEIGKLRVSHIYAASAMYGYFLKRVDRRFQLEKNMKTLPDDVDNGQHYLQRAVAEEEHPSGNGGYSSNGQPHPEMSWWSGRSGGTGIGGIKASRLRTYVMSFDAEMLQRYASPKSKEAITIIEKHTEALFGRPESSNSSEDEHIKISFGGLRILVLEAVTFGSFLWDVESYVDSRYNFVSN